MLESASGGGVCSGGVSALGGCLLGGVCSGGVSALGGSALGGLFWGGLLGGGVCSRGGGVVSQHALRQTPPVNRMTDRCKNITLATTSLRPVK